MNTHKTQVVDNTALSDLTHKIEGITLPNANRWKHEELESTLEGSHGFAKVRFGEPTWAHATSKPFGSVFKPKRPEVLGRNLGAFRKVNSLGKIQDLSKISHPQRNPVYCFMSNAETKNTLAESREKGARLCLELSAKATDLYASKVIKRAEAVAIRQAKKAKELSFKPKVIGLDKVRQAKPESVPDWQKEKEELAELTLYWLTLRSIYRLIYG